MIKDKITPGRRRKLWIAGGLLAAFTITGFFIAPPIIKSQIEKRASEALGRKVTVGRVRVNPYAVSLTLENFDVRLKEGEGPFLGWSRLYVNAEPFASIFGAWTIGAVELDGFHVTAMLKKDGTFNFADILERLNAATAAAPAKTPAKPVPAVRVGRLKVQGARLDFVDQSRVRPFATTFGPVDFSLTDFHSTAERGAPYHFEAVTETAEKFVWTGTLSAAPLASAGELRLENIHLPKYAAYYADRIRADLTEGLLSVHGRYEGKFNGGQHVLKLTDGAVQLRGLKLLERAGGARAVELPALDVSGINADAIALKATVAAVKLVGGHLHVRREQDGAINLLTMLLPPAVAAAQTPPPAETPPAPATKLPEFMIGEVELNDFQVDVADLAAARPAQLRVSGLEVLLRNVTLADHAVLPLSLALDWAPAGTVKAEGTVTIRPELKAELKTDVAGLALLPLSAYVEQLMNVHLTQGAVTTAGTVQVAMAGGSPAFTFEGGVAVDKFGLVDGTNNETLAGFGSLTLGGLKVVTTPALTVSLAEVALAAPYVRVLVNRDGTLNLAAVANVGRSLPPDSPAAVDESGQKAPPTLGTAPAPAPLPKITVGKVVIADGDFSLTDRSLEPNVRMGISQFGGTITGLSSENLARGDVDLKAVVDGSGPISITGKLDPLGAKKFVDLKVDFKNVDLLPLSPYSGKYAGYELARGKLNVDVQARLDDKQLDVANVITLNQFTFGAPVESKDATKLPVRLGVALLKDMNGQIVIDVPMSGNIDDPSLRLGKVVVRVVVNLLTKAAVSPFALLGSMFGGGGDELAYQDFAPGGAELLPVEIPKLATMVKALTNRPGLSVALEGGYDGPADTFALKQQKLAALVRGKIWDERHAVDPNIAPPAQLEITPEANAAMVKKLFDEKFPPGTEFGSLLPRAPVAAAPPPAPKKGLFGRVVDVVTLKGLRGGETKPAEAAAPPPAPAGASPAGPSLEEMTGRLAETMAVGDNDLRALATARAQRVRDYFLNEGQIAADRLFLTQGQAAAKENKGPRVFLSLQ
ncbi:MAG: DUF748 domain-containing protein [Lacunisphaera sp.]|nr:DUF748 domain-containing protein [Lacunisphaera sp.]